MQSLFFSTVMILCEYEDEVSVVFLLKRRRTALYRKSDIDFEYQMTHFNLEQLPSGGLAKNSEPILFEYSCQVTSGVNRAMLSH